MDDFAQTLASDSEVVSLESRRNLSDEHAMKLLFCEVCRDLVRPVTGKRGEPRFCICKRHAIWALDDAHAEVRVFDRLGVDGVPDQPAAYVLLISNRLLDLEGPMGATSAASLLADQASDLFKVCESLVVRIRPGEHPRTAWSDLPTGGGAPHWSTSRSV